MAITSGRGVITSRTRLSPNSTTDSIRRASSCSMIPSSVAASTKASMACCCSSAGVCTSLLFGQVQDRDQKLENRLHRPDDEEKHADDRNERQHPVARSARKQQRREKLHGDDYFGAKEKNHFDRGFPRAGNKEEHAARGDGGDQDEPETREQAEGQSGAVALHVEARLDFGFKCFEVRRGCDR